MTFTDAAVDADVKVMFCDLLTEGRQSCPGCGGEGLYRDTVTVPSSARSARNIRTEAAFSCGRYLRVVDLKRR